MKIRRGCGSGTHVSERTVVDYYTWGRIRLRVAPVRADSPSSEIHAASVRPRAHHVSASEHVAEPTGSTRVPCVELVHLHTEPESGGVSHTSPPQTLRLAVPELFVHAAMGEFTLLLPRRGS